MIGRNKCTRSRYDECKFGSRDPISLMCYRYTQNVCADSICWDGVHGPSSRAIAQAVAAEAVVHVAAISDSHTHERVFMRCVRATATLFTVFVRFSECIRFFRGACRFPMILYIRYLINACNMSLLCELRMMVCGYAYLQRDYPRS